MEGHPTLPHVFAVGTYQVDQEPEPRPHAAQPTTDHDGGHEFSDGAQRRADAEKDGRDRHYDADDDDIDKEEEGRNPPTSSVSPAYTRRGTVTLLKAIQQNGSWER